MAGKKSLALGRIFVLTTFFSLISACETRQQYPALQIFNCGAMEFSDIASFSDSGEFDGKEWKLVVPCYLIHHPNGLLIWDQGVSSAMVSSSNDDGSGISTTIDKRLVDSLAESGISTSDIDFIAMSHMHPDHTGNANLFAGTATWLTNDDQFDLAFRDDASTMGFDQNTFGELRNGPIDIIDDGHDVFGDGSVVILSAPGHTPGHQVLFINLNEYGPIVLSGDLHITRESHRKRLVPSFNFDRNMTLASIDRIDAFVKKRGARMIIQHSIADYDALPHAPELLH